MVCPCVPHDRRQCCIAFLATGVILGIIVGLVLIRGSIVVHSMSVTVDNASLATFALATPWMANSAPPAPTTTAAVAAVTYNLSMTVTLHNPNRYLDVHFTTPLEARYSFDGAFLGAHVWLAREGEKFSAGCTKVCRLTIDFARQSLAGVVEVDVVVAGNYTVIGSKRSLASSCVLKLPLGASPAASEKVKCV